MSVFIFYFFNDKIHLIRKNTIFYLLSSATYAIFGVSNPTFQKRTISLFRCFKTKKRRRRRKEGNGGQAKPSTGVVRGWVGAFHRPIAQSSPNSRVQSFLWLLDPSQCPSLWFYSLSLSLSLFPLICFRLIYQSHSSIYKLISFISRT
jgi:hypothetical protein